MADESQNVILAVVGSKPQRQTFDERITRKADNIYKRVMDLLDHVMTERNSILADFWNTTDGVGPVEVTEYWGPEKTFSVVAEDRELVKYLVSRFMAAKVSPAVIAGKILAPPPEYDIIGVQVTDDGKPSANPRPGVIIRQRTE
jgi:hypothetical protein